MIIFPLLPMPMPPPPSPHAPGDFSPGAHAAHVAPSSHEAATSLRGGGKTCAVDTALGLGREAGHSHQSHMFTTRLRLPGLVVEGAMSAESDMVLRMSPTAEMRLGTNCSPDLLAMCRPWSEGKAMPSPRKSGTMRW